MFFVANELKEFISFYIFRHTVFSSGLISGWHSHPRRFVMARHSLMRHTLRVTHSRKVSTLPAVVGSQETEKYICIYILYTLMHVYCIQFLYILLCIYIKTWSTKGIDHLSLYNRAWDHEFFFFFFLCCQEIHPRYLTYYKNIFLSIYSYMYL